MIAHTTFSAVSSPAIPYTRRELGLILLGEKNYTINPNPSRYVDIPLFAELAANHIISGYAREEYAHNCPSPEKDDLSIWICNIISEADCEIAVTSSALAQIDEYQNMMLELGEHCTYDVDEAHFLFLAAFMAAARAIHDEQSYLTYWTRVAGYEFIAEELYSMEYAFVDMMSDWRRRADVGSDDDDEDILYVSESYIPNAKSAQHITIPSSTSSSSSSSPSSSPSQLKNVSYIYGERETHLMRTLEAMTEGLKASARRWDPLHAHCSWFAEVDQAGPTYNICEDEKYPTLNRMSSNERREAQLLIALEVASQRLKESARGKSPIYARTSWLSRRTSTFL